NTNFTTSCGDSNEQIVVGTAAPALNTALHASAITVGSTDFDTSLLTGYVTGGTGGTVTYTVYTDSSCTMTPRAAGTVNVNAATGAVPNSNTLSFNAAGTFYWQAVFSGDSNNTGASSACSSEALVVGKASPTLTTQASPITGTAGVATTPAK